jgi:uncharacterized protein YbjT (DUF2867 family)
MSEAPRVGVIGGSSLVGRPLLPLLARRGGVLACARQIERHAASTEAGVRWHETGACVPPDIVPVPEWVTLCPLWAVPDHLDWLEQAGVERLVAVSSMSIVTKASSPDPAERQVAGRLASAERRLRAWAEGHGIALTLLVPTMIYDGVTDGNVAAIAAWVRRHGWFPLCGPALGLRQPVHAGDVAAACLAALERHPPGLRYEISGGEALPFRELVIRSSRAHGLAPRLVSLPPMVWNLAAMIARRLGIAGDATVAMGRRMNDDLSADHAAAARDLGFSPRPFTLDGDTLGEIAGPIGPWADGRRDER